jgi:hypothetical protein
VEEWPVNLSWLTRLRTVEEALNGPTWQEVLIKVEYEAFGDEPVEQGPQYVYRVPVAQLRRGFQRGGADESA